MATKDFKKKRLSIALKLEEKKRSKQNWIVFLSMLMFSMVLYANTIPHEYALDDTFVIVQNQYTQNGMAGIGDILSSDQFAGKYGFKKNIVVGGRYRPLSLITFAIEKDLFGDNPHISHFINILLYAINGFLIYLVLQLMFRKKANKWYLSIAYLASILFLAHPLHTEAVANIKGRDEILTFIFSLLAMLYTIKFMQQGDRKYIYYTFITFFLGLMSKENAITFLAIIPLTLYYFFDLPIKKVLKGAFLLVIPTLLFLLIRQLVLGLPGEAIEQELMNDPFIEMTFAEKYATIFYTLGLYLKLLVFPHPLTFDYYPYHIEIIQWSDPKAFVPVIIYALLIVIALIGIKSKSIYSWSILFFLATLSIVSNLLFPIGVFMNERFIYISSLALCILVAWFVIEKVQPKFQSEKQFNVTILPILALIILAFSVKTIMRNPAWKDSYTLFSTDIKTSPNSAKCNIALGEAIYHQGEEFKSKAQRKEKLKESMYYLRRAIDIHPRYANAMLLLGNAYFEYDRNVDSTTHYYLEALRVKPLMRDVYLNIETVAKALKTVDERIEFFEKVNSYYDKNFKVNYLLGTWYGKEKNDSKNAIKYLTKATVIDPTNFDALNNLGLVYGFQNDYENALSSFKRAEQFNRNDKQVLINIGVTYQSLGDTINAQKYFARVN